MSGVGMGRGRGRGRGAPVQAPEQQQQEEAEGAKGVDDPAGGSSAYKPGGFGRQTMTGDSGNTFSGRRQPQEQKEKEEGGFLSRMEGDSGAALFRPRHRQEKQDTPEEPMRWNVSAIAKQEKQKSAATVEDDFFWSAPAPAPQPQQPKEDPRQLELQKELEAMKAQMAQRELELEQERRRAEAEREQRLREEARTRELEQEKLEEEERRKESERVLAEKERQLEIERQEKERERQAKEKEREAKELERAQAEEARRAAKKLEEERKAEAKRLKELELQRQRQQQEDAAASSGRQTRQVWELSDEESAMPLAPKKEAQVKRIAPTQAVTAQAPAQKQKKKKQAVEDDDDDDDFDFAALHSNIKGGKAQPQQQQQQGKKEKKNPNEQFAKEYVQNLKSGGSKKPGPSMQSIQQQQQVESAREQKVQEAQRKKEEEARRAAQPKPVWGNAGMMSKPVKTMAQIQAEEMRKEAGLKKNQPLPQQEQPTKKKKKKREKIDYSLEDDAPAAPASEPEPAQNIPTAPPKADAALVAWAVDQLKKILGAKSGIDIQTSAELLCDCTTKDDLRSAASDVIGLRKGGSTFAENLIEKKWPAALEKQQLLQQMQQQQKQKPDPKSGSQAKGKSRRGKDPSLRAMLGFGVVASEAHAFNTCSIDDPE